MKKTRKALCLLLVLVMCMGLCACGRGGTKLTLDNYGTYFKIHHAGTTSAEEAVLPMNPVNGLYRDIMINGDYYEEYSGHIKHGIAFETAVRVSAISDNFNYNDVKFKVRVSGRCSPIRLSGNMWFFAEGPSCDFETIVEVPVDIAGNGRGTSVFHLPDGVISCVQSIEDHEIKMEVIEVSGVITGG